VGDQDDVKERKEGKERKRQGRGKERGKEWRKNRKKKLFGYSNFECDIFFKRQFMLKQKSDHTEGEKSEERRGRKKKEGGEGRGRGGEETGDGRGKSEGRREETW
jgi:hypothetical protein